MTLGRTDVQKLTQNLATIATAPTAAVAVANGSLTATGTANTLVDVTATPTQTIVNSNFRKVADAQALIITQLTAIQAALVAAGILV